MPTRYPLADHLPRENTSAVGTYQSPVLPSAVVVERRTGMSVCCAAGGWLGGTAGWAPAVVAHSAERRVQQNACRELIIRTGPSTELQLSHHSTAEPYLVNRRSVDPRTFAASGAGGFEALGTK